MQFRAVNQILERDVHHNVAAEPDRILRQHQPERKQRCAAGGLANLLDRIVDQIGKLQAGNRQYGAKHWEPHQRLLDCAEKAALETVLALRELVPDLLHIEVLTASPDFVYRPVAVAEPSPES